MEIKINLVPPYRKEEIKKAQYLKLVVRIEIILAVFIFVFFVFLFGLGKILDLNMTIIDQNSESSLESGQYEKIKNYDKKFREINSQISDITKIKREQLYWSNVLVRFGQSVSSGISIQDLSSKNYSIFLVGKADSRDNLILFKEKLEKDGCFSNVNLPLSNLVSKDSVDFQMDLEIKEECAKGENME